MAEYRIPTATYRFQFNAGFTFADARSLIPYLHSLGISDVYASPIFEAREGSEHGYDVIDLSRISPALGGESGFRAFAAELQHYEMGLLLDIVPNHMAADTTNPWWRDVLNYGPNSPYASLFDIDWKSSAPSPAFSPLVLPILGAPYGQELEGGQLKLALEGLPVLRYWSHRFPLYIGTLAPLLKLAEEKAQGNARRTFQSAVEQIRSLPPNALVDKNLFGEARQRAIEFEDSLREGFRTDPASRQAMLAAIEDLNGSAGNPSGFDALDALLSTQPYRLVWWRKAAEAVNFRRFFDINELVGLRVEDPAVFSATHASVLKLIKEGLVTGLRLDHIDGLYDPQAYLTRLQQSIGKGESESTESPKFYVVAEKIVGTDEQIPKDWPVSGTTGYEFLNQAHGVFVDHLGLKTLARTYQRFSGSTKTFADVVYESKLQVLRELFSGEVERFTAWLLQIAASDRYARDLPRKDLKRAFIEIGACFPVYRTYTQGFTVAERDRIYIERAFQEAKSRIKPTEASAEALSFLRRVLLLSPLPTDAGEAEERLAFVRRWQQFTGPATAKGLEDTAFYRHNRLISLNAVGGDVQEVEHPVHVDGFHRFNAEQLRLRPHTLNATTTHDTKRSEDVEMRINVISELPRAWARRFRKWSRFNASKKTEVEGTLAPDANEEIFLYQVLLGAWPLHEHELPDFIERIRNVMRKALREEKIHSSWLAPNLEWEQAVDKFIVDILTPQEGNRFPTDIFDFHSALARHGCWNSLAQVLLKITVPGIPDIYRGTELWDFSLVDPDNRRALDFALRKSMLARLQQDWEANKKILCADLMNHWRDGRIKMFLTWKALTFRRDNDELFRMGDYIPLQPAGVRARNVCAFARRNGTAWALVFVPRLSAILRRDGAPPIGHRIWRDTHLELPQDAPTTWSNVFTGESVVSNHNGRGMPCLKASQLLNEFPAGLFLGKA